MGAVSPAFAQTEKPAVVPSGTVLTVRLTKAVGSEISKTGDAFFSCTESSDACFNGKATSIRRRSVTGLSPSALNEPCWSFSCAPYEERH